MQITRSSIDTMAGPGDRFTGTVYIDAVAAPSGTSQVMASNVHFTPGARTAWHTHPNGQTIFVLEGVGHCAAARRPRRGDGDGGRALARCRGDAVHAAPSDRPGRRRGKLRDVARSRHGCGVRERRRHSTAEPARASLRSSLPLSPSWSVGMALEPFSREEDRATVEAFVGRAEGGASALVLEGEAGIGKSTLWLAGVQVARSRGLRVLLSRPAEAERGLAHAGLGDLLEDALADVPL